MDELFKKYVTIRKLKDCYKASCKKGLWNIYAKDKEDAIKEAKRYFIQYLEDGEYN